MKQQQETMSMTSLSNSTGHDTKTSSGQLYSTGKANSVNKKTLTLAEKLDRMSNLSAMKYQIKPIKPTNGNTKRPSRRRKQSLQQQLSINKNNSNKNIVDYKVTDSDALSTYSTSTLGTMRGKVMLLTFILDYQLFFISILIL